MVWKGVTLSAGRHHHQLLLEVSINTQIDSMVTIMVSLDRLVLSREQHDILCEADTNIERYRIFEAPYTVYDIYPHTHSCTECSV